MGKAPQGARPKTFAAGSCGYRGGAGYLLGFDGCTRWERHVGHPRQGPDPDRHHPNSEVRQRVLDALDWVGSDALYDLADMLDDENSEIADAATESFWEQIADLPNDQAKLKLLEGFSNSQDPEMLSRLAEELSNYHPYVAHDLILSILSTSPNTVNEDIQWELEGMTGESFETTSKWQEWFIENSPSLEADYKGQDFR